MSHCIVAYQSKRREKFSGTFNSYVLRRPQKHGRTRLLWPYQKWSQKSPFLLNESLDCDHLISFAFILLSLFCYPVKWLL